MKKFSLVLVTLMLLLGCTTEIPAQTTAVNIYFVADTPRGLKLFSESREFTTPNNLAQLVISELVSGQLMPLDPDYTNLWDGSHSLNQLAISGATATVDLNLGKLNLGAEGEQRAIDQILWTLNSASPAITSVRFLVNGKTVETFAGHIDTTVAFKQAPGYEVLNPLQISSIVEGALLSNPIIIKGQACTFEANLIWKLVKNGDLIDESFTTATSACPQRGEWSVTLDELPAGTYSFEVIEYSAENGSLFAIDSKTFVVN